MIYNTRYLPENFEQCRLEKTILWHFPYDFNVHSSFNALIHNGGKHHGKAYCENSFSTVCETNPMKSDKYQNLERGLYQMIEHILFCVPNLLLLPQTRNSFNFTLICWANAYILRQMGTALVSSACVWLPESGLNLTKITEILHKIAQLKQFSHA